LKKWRLPSKIKFPNSIKEEDAMVELTINVPEIKRFLNQIVEAPEKIFGLLRGGCSGVDESIFKSVDGSGADLLFRQRAL